MPSTAPARRCLVAVALLASAPASAHPLDVGALTVQVAGDTLTAKLDLGAALAASLFDGGVPGASALGWATLGNAPLRAGEISCAITVSPEFASPDGDAGSAGGSAKGSDRLAVSAQATCPPGAGPLTWRFPFIGQLPFSFRVLVRVDTARGSEEQILSAAHDTLTFLAPEAEPERHFGQFVLMGMQHIGATPGEWLSPDRTRVNARSLRPQEMPPGGPPAAAAGRPFWQRLRLPDGIDHILFLVALLLTGVQLVPVLKTVTGFTVGHSITLTLATLGWVQLPGRLVESAIALSIAYVAAEDLWIKTPRARWQLAAAFGLVHGFGFARALADLKLGRGQLASALFGFNIGVELGQELLVILLAPLLWLLFRQRWFREVGRPVCALAILGLALGWFVQRAFG